MVALRYHLGSDSAFYVLRLQRQPDGGQLLRRSALRCRAVRFRDALKEGSLLKVVSGVMEVVVGLAHVVVGLALLGAFLYGFYFVAWPAGQALFNDRPGDAVGLVRRNVTHWPPVGLGEYGVMMACSEGRLENAAARRLESRVLEIGRRLEAEHGYEMVEGTDVSVVRSLGAYGGLAHSGPGVNCIQMALNWSWLEGHDSSIAHEWAHIAADGLTLGAAHGPEWRAIAREFGVEGVSDYDHCRSGDHDCRPRNRSR